MAEIFTPNEEGAAAPGMHDIAEQVSLRAQLLTARFGSTPDGDRVPLTYAAADFVSRHLDVTPLEAGPQWPRLPYAGHRLGIIDNRPSGNNDRTRYYFSWLPVESQPVLAIDRIIGVNRKSTLAVSQMAGSWAIDALYGGSRDQSAREDLAEDISQVSEAVCALGRQGRRADIARLPTLNDPDLALHSRLRRFVQLPPGLLWQN